MGIVRKSSTRFLVPRDRAREAVLEAMSSLGIEIRQSTDPLIGDAKRSLRKNRWAANITAALRSESSTSTVIDWTVDMAGDQHFAVVAEIVAATTAPVDDLGVAAALERLNKMGRLFGWLEARSLIDHVHVDERVLELAQGIYNGAQGLLVLTTQRVFFFDKGFKTAQIEEFHLPAITSLVFVKSYGNEGIDITAAGRSASIRQVASGRAEAFVSAFHRSQSAAPTPTARSDAPDLTDQIRKLGELRDAGVLTEGEFTTKKTELLRRI